MSIKSKKLSPKLAERAFLIPALITVTGLFAGFVSIICSINLNFEQAVKWIALAFILDGLDGNVARKLNAASPFGREFDSLCDLVAFGVSPAIMIWSWTFKGEFEELGVLISFLFVAAGATRLARFNIITTSEPKSYFIGMPIPGAAACLASLVYAYPVQNIGSSLSTSFYTSLIMAYMVLLSALMVSTIKFESFKRVNLNKFDPKWVLLGLCIFVAIVWKFHRVSLLLILTGYAFSGPIGYFTRNKNKIAEN